MFRVALTFDPGVGWRVVKSWKVNPEYASRAVDIDRRSKRKRLLILSPFRLSVGPANPREILALYMIRRLK